MQVMWVIQVMRFMHVMQVHADHASHGCPICSGRTSVHSKCQVNKSINFVFTLPE